MSLFGLHIGKEKFKEQERHLQANNREFNEKFEYASNSIKTSKYNIITFLPLNLFEQFQRLANAYFLVLLVLQFIPQISSLVWYTTVIPLVLVLSISGVKDAIDDLNRHKSDNHVNHRPVQVLVNGMLKEDIWMNVQVGDIIKLEKDHFVTADVLLLSSSEPHSLAYIETAELDGETNLKVKQALTVTSEMGDNLERLAAFDGEVRCEPPNNKLDKFTGTLIHKEEKHALDNEKMLLRGCTIRNTEWCYGLVIFAGPDTKLMQNSGKATFKRTSIDHLMNVLVFSIFLFLAAMCLILAIGNGIWEKRRGFYFQIYLPWAEEVNSATLSALLIFWSYVIILNTVVPISLYVSVEIIRLGNSFYIDWDRKMYYSVNNTPAQARTTTLNEELGQIKYVFSDKTGTLTQNIMAFNKCSINGKSYGDVYDLLGQRLAVTEETETVDFSYNELADPKFAFYDHSLVEAVKLGDTAVHQFFLSLSLCHTVMSEEKEEGNLVYQAQSPDEGALVTAARNFGFVFRSRTPETITVVEMGETRVYQLLAILDFTNVRKRMSVIVRDPEGKLILFCKGADTIIYTLLDSSSEALKDVTMEHLNEFAGEGLRTLVVAYRQLDESYFNTWITRHHEASTALEEREEKLAMLYQEIESNLMLLGATAIEDKLQDGVPETIETLTRAKINVWVLTGDKQETAMNIGYSCNMLDDDMDKVFVIEGQDSQTVLKELREARKEMRPESFLDTDPVNIRISQPTKENLILPEENASGNFGMVINGHSLAFALEAKLELELLRAACMCKAVICCRVTPLQKAQVVELVKRHKNAVTLAIGDGANDVSMIKTAHIGVGISGQEGMQAVLSSDFSFAQFRFLQRLLLVHGRWSYIRMCKFLRYFFYKNFAFTLVHFWYGFFSGFSAQTVYDEWFITLYNLVYTSLPVLGMSLFDQDVNDYWSLRFPELYEPGQHNLYFNKREFIKCMVHGIYSSLILFFVPFGTVFNSVRSDGKTISDYQSFALMAQTSLLMVVSVQIGLDTAYWTAVNQFFIWGSLAVYFAITFTMYSDGMYLIFTSSFRFIGTARNTLNQPEVWLSIFLSVILCMLPIAGYRFLKAELKPTTNDKVLRKIRESMKKPLPPPPKARLRRTSSRRSGYAFSHQHGFGALITSGRNMRAKSPFATTGTYSPNK
ncbi:phospholipid-transporting ATPase FetA-like [Ornithorhynchus anatinus]|uniref:phospholipid-transporting ATPase FetA-like n=1 Tax=Ornithorhynchus anatinus TaxID=9258 RepID=UPI0010A82FEA|nr:phospholipid-transporting ATPase FetA-like [Ornithorhynchus anatinus]XP_028916123.1 phospholipid-transporting ATPase FetA-like [Ornithorhynchus anatinus]XP_028916124.1 phospholipid-transporting ATPase FetA-like [Ornithorhynchus anatinus]XP_028916125.1 phospholipid-transporting ATPase FetA-like [Ornithorhynchus anatinus]XP_028916126.1 phospholipid-transporting ATPase FetA-like [Ornithorhynchus anatinus]XP_028916127.1 phospholipid-transporting ATPase FetA-like [Ornithorhynchus anatinus]